VDHAELLHQPEIVPVRPVLSDAPVLDTVDGHGGFPQRRPGRWEGARKFTGMGSGCR
jgi:hypothetical protein